MTRKRRRKNGNNGIYIFGASISVLLLIGALTFAWTSSNPRNPVTGCSDDSSNVQNTYAILLDATDPYSQIQLRKVENLIESLIGSTQQEDRFQVYRMTASETDVISPIFDRCNYEASFSDSPALERFRRSDFENNLYSSISSTNGGNISPIVHAIDAVSTNMPTDSSTKHLIVVSDFYENSSVLNMYTETTARLPNLRGVNVFLRVISRQNLVQDRAFIEGWLSLLTKAGANLKDITVGAEGAQTTLTIAERITG
jgi:hypothetical protein